MDEEKKQNQEGGKVLDNINDEDAEINDSINTENEEIDNGSVIHDEANEKSNEKSSDLKNPNRKKIYIICGLIIIILICIWIIVNNTVTKYENLVYPGIMLYGQDISELTYEELSNELNNIESDIKDRNIIINSNDKEFCLESKDIIKENNKEELLNSVMNSGKDGNFIAKFFSIISKKEIDFKLQMEVDKDKLEDIVTNISNENNKVPKNPHIIIDGDNIDYVDGEYGLSLNCDNLMDEIEKSLADNYNNKDIVLYGEYEKESPTININDLKKVDTKISEYSTYYGGGTGRGTNIEVAAKKLDNLILMPGEEFSYEQTIGPVSAKNGYKEASVIINGEIQNGIGGGVCQVSSTLYNTQLKAGLLPTQRRNHSKAVDYVPRGLDATLASGSIDYRFINTYDYPIVLNTYTSNGYLYIEIWSNKDTTKGITYEPVSYVSGNRAETYLYGYDVNKNKVYEKFIDTSVYK